ncbi:MAG: ATP-binding protein, partial [Acidobacteriota bacterium]
TVNYLSDLEQRFSDIRKELDMAGQIDFQTVVIGEPRPLLSAVGEETHQICREALTNAFRHSGATVIEVEIEYSARLFRIVVRDNGRGIDPKIISLGREGHFGLSGMRERANGVAGQFKVFSRPEGGTEAELSIPGRFAFEAHFSNIVSRWFHGRRRTKPKKEVSE